MLEGPRFEVAAKTRLRRFRKVAARWEERGEREGKAVRNGQGKSENVTVFWSGEARKG